MTDICGLKMFDELEHILFGSPEAIPVIDDGIGSTMKLRPYPYQRDLIRFCLDAKNALIVAPCGAGKSPTLIGLYIEALRNGIIKGPGLIVVKASLKVQWAHEVEKFSDLKPAVIQTSKKYVPAKMYKAVKKLEAEAKKLSGDALVSKQVEIYDAQDAITHKVREQFEDADLCILNYETLADEEIRKALHEIKPQFVAADEVQYVKSSSAKRSKHLYEVSKDAIVRVGATATPVQHDPLDIFGIYKFLKPDLFPKKGAFERFYVRYGGFGRVIGSMNEKDLHNKIKSYMIIKTKEEVSKQLPKLVVSQRYYAFTDKQYKKNAMIMEQLDALNEQAKALEAHLTPEQAEHSEEYQKLKALVQMYQGFAAALCDSEELLNMSSNIHASEYTTNGDNPKLDGLMELLEEHWEADPQEKICVFSKSVRMQEVMLQRLEKEMKKPGSALAGTKVSVVNGSMNGDQRYEQLYTKFQGSDPMERLLICSDAAAEGVNLSKCHVLVEYEPAESYAIETQRHGRIQRADSVADTSEVIQLLIEGRNDVSTWDEIMQKSINKKEGYDSMIIHGDCDPILEEESIL